MPHARKQTGRPVVTLLTDFGLADSYVAEMKAVLLREAADAQIVDVTHLVPPQDVLAGSIALERAVAAFGPGTIHLAVVDPGVGSTRRILLADVRGQFVVCPDNGLITWAWRRHGGGRVREVTWRPTESSHTFHGRDIMAPVAARLATGGLRGNAARPIDEPILLDVAPANSLAEAVVIHIDHFGNATTNVPAELLEGVPSPTIRVGRRSIGGVRRAYSEVEPGEALALVGSSGLLEIAMRNGSAKKELRLEVRQRIRIGERT